MSYRCVRCQSEYPTAVAFCWGCGSMDTVVLAPNRPQSVIDSEPQVATAKDLVKRTWDSLCVDAACPGLRLQPGALVVVTGPPGAGKSTLALRLADTSELPVVVLSLEERLGASVGARLSRLGLHRDDFYVVGRSSVDDSVALIRKTKAAVVVVDSVQAGTYLPQDLRNLVVGCGLRMLVAVSQVTKDGVMRGTRELEHEADVVLELEEGRWTTTKSRYGPTGLGGEVPYDRRSD